MTYGTIGQAIYKLRLKARLTQVQLAKAVGVTQSSIAFYESGRMCPSDATAKKLAKQLETSLDFLLAHRRKLFSD